MEINLEILSNAKRDGMRYKEISKFPNVVKDVAFVMDNEITSEQIEKVIRKVGGKRLVSVEVFDVYTGVNLGNKKSIAYTLTFNDKEKTLSDDEVTAVFNKIIDKVTTECNVTLRDC